MQFPEADTYDRLTFNPRAGYTGSFTEYEAIKADIFRSVGVDITVTERTWRDASSPATQSQRKYQLALIRRQAGQVPSGSVAGGPVSLVTAQLVIVIPIRTPGAAPLLPRAVSSGSVSGELASTGMASATIAWTGLAIAAVGGALLILGAARPNDIRCPAGCAIAVRFRTRQSTS